MSFWTCIDRQLAGNLLSIRTNHGAIKGSSSRLILDQSGSFVAIIFGHSGEVVAYCTAWRFSNCVSSPVCLLFRQINPSHQFPSIISVCTVFPSARSLAINRYFVFSTAVVRKCRLLQYIPSSFGVCLHTSLWHCELLVQSSPMARNWMFMDVFGRLNRVLSKCVATQIYQARICRDFNNCPVLMELVIVGFTAWVQLITI